MALSLPFLLFFGVVFSLLFGMHYYLWLRLVHDVALNPTTKNMLTILLSVLGANIPVALLTSRSARPEVVVWWVKPGYAWFGVSFLLVVAVVCVDLLRLGYQAISTLNGATIDHGERQALAHLVAVAGSILGLGTVAIAFLEAARLRVKRVEVSLENLPMTLVGTTIVQLSDMHVGATVGRTFVQQVVTQVNALKPDIVAITGDLVDGSVEDLARHVSPLRDIESRLGTFFITGNHEYYSDAPAWCRHLNELGIRVLRNEHIALGPQGEHLYLAGVDDLQAERFPGLGHGPNVARAVQGRDPAHPLILLAHQPKVVIEAAKHNVDLQLSGHTHGGQLWPFNWLMRLQQPVVAGLGKFGRTWLYVSCGTGHGGLPLRLMSPPEVTLIVLRRA